MRNLLLILALLAGSVAHAAESRDPVESARSIRVRSGQTLSGIVFVWAKKHFPRRNLNFYGQGGLLEAVLKLNPSIEDPDRLSLGQHVLLPDSGQSAEGWLRPRTVARVRHDRIPDGGAAAHALSQVQPHAKDHGLFQSAPRAPAAAEESLLPGPPATAKPYTDDSQPPLPPGT